MILAGDIGGTSVRLGFFELRQGRLHPVRECTYPSRRYKGLEEVAVEFVKAHQVQVEQACFGVAGPVLEGRVHLPNLGWQVDAQVLARELSLKSVSLINDLEANAYGIAALEPSDVVVLQAGVPQAKGNAAVISAGTGLGEAGLYWDGQRHYPFACEGGHCDFAPRNELESELLQYLRKRYVRVSYERVLSGPGLQHIFEFLRETGRGEVPPALEKELSQADPSMVISRAAREKRYPICMLALDLFISFYGAEAGNLALKIMATGGVYVGGGIAPQLIEQLKGPTFVEAFVSKGRMRTLLERIPLRVIMNDKTALLGAACCAARSAGLL